MKNNFFSDHAAGAKTTWIIDFKQNDEPLKKDERPPISFYKPSTLKVKEKPQEPLIDEKAFEKVKEDYAKFLDAITKLCLLLEKNCQENIKELDISKEDVKSVDSSITSLGQIIKKFNEMIKRLRKKSE